MLERDDPHELEYNTGLLEGNSLIGSTWGLKENWMGCEPV